MEYSLSIKLDYDSDISLREFTSFLTGIEYSYSNYGGAGTELSIHEINKGSIEIIFTIMTTLQPIFYEVYKQLLVDYAKSFIHSLKKTKENPELIIESIRKENKEDIQSAEIVSNVTGNYNTIKNINILLNYNGKVEDSVQINSKEMNDIRDIILPALDEYKMSKNKKNRDSELYESVVLTFSTVSDIISDVKSKTFVGQIKDIDSGFKKITFINDDIENSFDFVSEPFNKSYLVDVLVFYNKNNSIAKYEIQNNLKTI